jgi:hypothetical protein
MQIENVVKKEMYPVEFDILHFLYNNEDRRGRMILRYNNGMELIKIVLTKPVGEIKEDKVKFNEGIDAVAESLTNMLLNGNKHFIGINYKEDYKKFSKNTMFIFQKKEIANRDYKLSVYGSVEFKELN